VKASCTSAKFAAAWDAAIDPQDSGIPNLAAVRDASDAGNHHFSSNASALDTNWTKRSTNVGTSANEVSYKIYTTSVMNSPLN
jgi:hypothetical protein